MSIRTSTPPELGPGALGTDHRRPTAASMPTRAAPAPPPAPHAQPRPHPTWPAPATPAAHDCPQLLQWNGIRIGSTVPRFLGTKEPSFRPTEGPSFLVLLVSWSLGPLVPWFLGSLDHGSLFGPVAGDQFDQLPRFLDPKGCHVMDVPWSLVNRGIEESRGCRLFDGARSLVRWTT
jgi:hypothetical protein